MQQNKEKKIDKLYLILLGIIIFLLHLFIGSSHQDPKSILQTIILAIGLTYIIIKKIQCKKNLVIKGKIDLLMLILLIATFIPLILKTYYSLNDTINFFIDFVCAYVIYILARNLIKSKKELSIIIDVTLISSIIIVVFGLDKLHYNIFAKFLEFINSARSNTYGMISTVGYSNPVAAYMTLLSFFALGRCLCIENTWKKSIYSAYIQIAMIGFAFGNSRALMVIFPIVFIAYLITLKGTKNRIQATAIIGTNIVTAYIFQEICNKFVTNNFNLWLSFILDIAIIYFISIAIYELTEKISIKMNKKKILISVIIVITLITTYFLAVKNIGETVEIDGPNKTLELLGLKNNYDYNIKISITAKVQEDVKPALKLACYSSQRTQEEGEEQKIQNGEQTLEFNIHTEEDFERVRIYILNPKYEQNKITLNHVYVNNKEYILDFKYLPNDIIRMLRTLNSRTVSIYERIAFCQDSLKLAQNHIIFGAGGKTFANHIKPYQSYQHGYNEESHSYILDMLLNYGLFGLITYVAILISTIYTAIKTIKQKTREKDINLPLYISILFGIIMFTLHATIDFDLAYLFTLSMYYMFIGILNKHDNELKNNKFKYIDYAIIILMIISLTITTRKAISNYFVKKENYEIAYAICNYSEGIKKQIIYNAYKNKDINTLEKYLPIYIKDEKYKNNFSIINKLGFVINKNLRSCNINKANTYLEILYNYITKNDNLSKVKNEKQTINTSINDILNEIERQGLAMENEETRMWYEKFKTNMEN